MTRFTFHRFPLLALALALAPLAARAFPSYYDANCSACHGTTTAGGVQTCAGCHAHGSHPSSAKSSLNLTGATDKSSYAPGETVRVTINAGYRSGWVRALLYDQNMRELARSAGSVLPGFLAPCCGASFPVTLSAPAPTTPGSYTWVVAWYGNQYDAGGAFYGPGWTPSANPGHGEERVQTNAFAVVAPTAPRLALAPPALAFGNVNVGTSASLVAQVQNTGTADLSVSSIAPCAGTSSQFGFSPAGPLTVAPGQAAALTVTFTATDASTETGCLTLASNDPASPTATLGLSATGVVPPAPAIALSPTALSFGTVTLGSTATLPVDVVDAGNAALTVSSIATCSGTPAVFTWSPAAPFTVQAAGRTTLSVTYAPVAAGGDSGCLVLSSDDPANPAVRLAVSGNGAAPAAPAIAFSPATLDFGTVTIGNRLTRTAQVQNTGNAALTVSAIAACSGAGGEFTWSASLPLTVAPGGSAPLPVTYTPADIDFHSSCLAVSSDDPARPVANLALTAQGAAAPTPGVALSPAALDFATVQVGSSASQVVQVQSTGSAALDVTAIAACPGTSSEFAWSPAAPFPVAAGQSAALTVRYAPVDAGPDNGCLILSTTDPLHPTVSLGLSGSGAVSAPVPVIALVPEALSFGTVTVGGTASRTAEIRDLGTAPLQVLSIAPCAGTSAEFGWSPAAPFSVAPGQAAVLTVTYAPADAGADSGCLAIASDDPVASTVRLALDGSGAVEGGAFDLDIVALQVPRVAAPGAALQPRLVVRNASTVDGTGSARLLATLAGTEVYRQQLDLAGVAPGAQATFAFPTLVAPAPRGGERTLRWRVTVTDQDPDVDQASAATALRRRSDDDDRLSAR